MAHDNETFAVMLEQIRHSRLTNQDVAHFKEQFALFVEHPRYGRHPHFTGLNPETVFGGDTFLHWNASKECRIPHTAIPADLSRQTDATVPVTHYYDVIRTCRDCDLPFIFFAQEQKYWYEQLNLPLEVDCVRCVPCRKQQQKLAKIRKRYETLFHVSDPTPTQTLEMADCCLTLVEASIFHARQTHHVHMLLNRAAASGEASAQHDDLAERLHRLEAILNQSSGEA